MCVFYSLFLSTADALPAENLAAHQQPPPPPSIAPPGHALHTVRVHPFELANGSPAFYEFSTMHRSRSPEVAALAWVHGSAGITGERSLEASEVQKRQIHSVRHVRVSGAVA